MQVGKREGEFSSQSFVKNWTKIEKFLYEKKTKLEFEEVVKVCIDAINWPRTFFSGYFLQRIRSLWPDSRELGQRAAMEEESGEVESELLDQGLQAEKGV